MRALRNSLIIVGAVFIIAVLAIVGTKLFAGPSGSVSEAQSESATSPAAGEKDSPAQKGSWTATAQGVPVYLPDNGDGDVLAKELAASEMETCDPMVNPRAPEETRVEKVHGRYLLFTVKDGPSKIEDGVPVGYSHTPAGAATALYNASAVLTPVNADGSPDSTSQAAANKLYEPKLGDLPSGEQVYSLKDAGFPFYFRVLGCNPEVVTVEYGVGYRSGEVVATIRSQAVWRDGDWKFNVMAPTEGEAATKEDVVGWASWKIG